MADQEKKNDQVQYMPLGLCIGLSLGVAIGAAMGNVGVGMCMGLGIGMCFGAALDARKKNTEQETIEKKEDDEQ